METAGPTKMDMILKSAHKIQVKIVECQKASRRSNASPLISFSATPTVCSKRMRSGPSSPRSGDGRPALATPRRTIAGGIGR